MKVFKFGGASVKDAKGVKNLVKIVASETEQLVVVVSAMGKITNALEELLVLYRKGNSYDEKLNEIRVFHLGVVAELFTDSSEVKKALEFCFSELEQHLRQRCSTYDFDYDAIVSYGELLSTIIVAHYFRELRKEAEWVDVRKIICTKEKHRITEIDWEESEKRIKTIEVLVLSKKTIITQGFIASNKAGETSTLGREGSDFSAAILAFLLNANEVCIWKDVPGLLNADPKLFPQAQLLDNISYYEAIELAFYGARVIHPKTIKPLQNKGIPLRVKSFEKPSENGSLINDNHEFDAEVPSYIVLKDQVLLSIFPRDYSFIGEGNLSKIFSIFSSYGITINLMQNAALSFSVCFNNDENLVPSVLEEIQQLFSVKYNTNLELLTIRHYTEELLNTFLDSKSVLIEQKNRTTVQLVLKT